jgi:hypothetical protein
LLVHRWHGGWVGRRFRKFLDSCEFTSYLGDCSRIFDSFVVIVITALGIAHEKDAAIVVNFELLSFSGLLRFCGLDPGDLPRCSREPGQASFNSAATEYVSAGRPFPSGNVFAPSALALVDGAAVPADLTDVRPNYPHRASGRQIPHPNRLVLRCRYQVVVLGVRGDAGDGGSVRAGFDP